MRKLLKRTIDANGTCNYEKAAEEPTELNDERRVAVPVDMPARGGGSDGHTQCLWK